MNLDANLLLVGGMSIFHGISLNLAILQLNALSNLLQVVSRTVLVEEDVINLLLEVFRVREF